MRWKRCRRSLKEQRDEAGFLEGRRVLEAFHARKATGDRGCSTLMRAVLVLVLVCLTPGSPQGDTLRLPAHVPGRANVSEPEEP